VPRKKRRAKKRASSLASRPGLLYSAGMASEDPSASGRIVFVGRYRGFLISLVILIHTSITYGAAGSWYFSQPHDILWVKIVGTFICSFAQSFALGAFFFISAYFLPDSVDRKGVGRALQDRAVRLGIPFFIYYFLVNPLLVMAVSGWGHGRPIPFGPWFGSGPLWFVEALFVFVAMYCVGRLILKSPIRLFRWSGPPTTLSIWIYIVIAAALGFLARVFFPIGWQFSNLQLGFFPMYIILFMAGIKASRERWLELLGRVNVGPWAILSVVGILAYPVLLVGGGALHDVAPFMGGLAWQNAAYALWEAVTGTSLFITTIVLFFHIRWRTGRLADSFGESSYGIYFFHAAVIILLAIAMVRLPIHPAFKWLILSFVGICGSWAITAAVRSIHGVSRVL